ncbi:MAG: hypothetical protein AAGA33_03035 [Pseudomonadota bacterium]
MGIFRPGTRVRFWTPRYTNRPDIGPPLPLRIVSGLSILSVVGTLLYAVFETLSTLESWGLSAFDALYIAVLHFLLPLAAAYTLSGNYPISRLVVSLYCLTLAGATATGRGMLGALAADSTLLAILVPGLLVSFVAWLFLAPGPRAYYLMVAGRDVPEPLRSAAASLKESRWLSERVRHALDRLLDYLELFTMIGFIVTVILVVAFL